MFFTRRSYQRSFLASLVLSLAALAACNDPNTTKLQYAPDMADSAALKSQRDFLDPPAGSISTGAILYPATIEQSEQLLRNPLPTTKEAEAAGKVLYDTFCITCHGVDGKGQGTITDLYPMAPDLTHPVNDTRQDGFYFHKITFGGAIMPGYGHAIAAHERWQIAHYLRVLQRRAKGIVDEPDEGSAP